MQDHLKTKRLTLRLPVAADAARITEIVADPRVHRMVARVSPNQTKEMTLAWLMSHDAGRRADTDHVYTYELDGQLAGLVGAHRASTHEPFELGYWLAPEAWNKGYVTEAAGRLLDALIEKGERAFTSGYFVDNPASGRVLEKLGFMHAGRAMVMCLGRNEKVEHFNMARLLQSS